MALTDYLHGVDWVRDPNTITPVEFPRSGIIGLVGTAPVQHCDAAYQVTDKPTLVYSATDAVRKFGPVSLDDYTIPRALEAIYQQGVALCVVVNVFDPADADHYEAVTAEAKTFNADGALTLAHGDVWNAVVKNQAGTTTYVAGTDYAINEVSGEILRIATGAIAAGAQVQIDYRYGTPADVTVAEVVGEITTGGLRTGMKAWLDSYHHFGFHPRILIAPWYSQLPTAAAELTVLADKLLAHAGIDAPIGATVEDCITGRNDDTGVVKVFKVADTRVCLCYPHVNNTRGELLPLSAYWAGVFSRTQDEYGYHWSPSNKPIRGLTGAEVALSSTHTLSESDVQLLNSVGIVTVYGVVPLDAYATGYRLWGNRSSAYPSTTDPINFICIQVVEDQIRIALERALLQYVDRPLNNVTISFVLQTINMYLARQKAMGILIDGNAYFLDDDNPIDELAMGHLTLRLDQAGPPPLERITIRARYNENFLRQLSASMIARTASDLAIGMTGR